jgi:hypothetical protein
MRWGILRIVEHLTFYDGPTRQHFVWLIFETASYSSPDVVCVKLLHGGGVGKTGTISFAGLIQSGAATNST